MTEGGVAEQIVPGLIEQERRLHAHHEGPSEEFDIHACGRVADPERSAELREVQDLPVMMGAHPPQALDRRCGYRYSQPGDIPFEECSDEAPSPAHARHGDLREQKGRKLEVHQPSCQALGTLPNQFSGGGTQDEESAIAPVVINDAPQELEDVRLPLGLVQTHEVVRVRM